VAHEFDWSPSEPAGSVKDAHEGRHSARRLATLLNPAHRIEHRALHLVELMNLVQFSAPRCMALR
jgi:hypothetical protein